MQITAAVAHEPQGEFVLEGVTLESPRDDEVLVEIRGVGLCHTDIAARDGVFGLPYPMVLGHEGSGVVTEVGSAVTKVAPGDPVAITFNSCGACVACRSGDPAYCQQFPALNYGGARADGSSPLSSGDGPVTGSFFGQSSFGTHALANERNVVKVDGDVPLELVGTLGCGLQTGAGAIMRSLACEPGSSLLVLGAGPVGLAAVMAGVIQGCEQILVSEPHAKRRALAETLGATHSLDPAAGELSEQVRGILADGVDYAFDTTGHPAVLTAVMQCMAPKGSIGLVGVPADFAMPVPLNLVQSMVLGLTVRGITEGDSDPDEFIPQLLELYRDGRFPFDRMITTFPFSQINEAIEAQHRGDAIKVVLTADAPAGS
jgi:aryl-alcohol dehydrogenase